MQFVLYTNILSPHQLPLARRLVRTIGTNQFRYVYRDEVEDRAQLGWPSTDVAGWITRDTAVCETAEMLLSGIRDVGLFERRAAKGLTTLYMSERWFKPGKGMLRLLSPGYLKMAGWIVKLIKNDSQFVYLPIGVHAAEDMARLFGLFSGDLRCLWRAPKLEFDRMPGGAIHLTTKHTKYTNETEPLTTEHTEQTEENDGKVSCVSRLRKERWYGFDKMRLWGYFVEPSSWNDEKLKELRAKQREEVMSGKRPLRILWVGRMLDWKRVDTLVKAVKLLNAKVVRATLTLVGYGPEETKLHALAMGHNEIAFHQQVPIDQVRSLMREHDLYVLPSNAFEGWGAVVSEAIMERMPILGTYEAGASATMLNEKNLFHAGDVIRLSEKIKHVYELVDSYCGWDVSRAVTTVMKRLR